MLVNVYPVIWLEEYHQDKNPFSEFLKLFETGLVQYFFLGYVYRNVDFGVDNNDDDDSDSDVENNNGRRNRNQNRNRNRKRNRGQSRSRGRGRLRY